MSDDDLFAGCKDPDAARDVVRRAVFERRVLGFGVGLLGGLVLGAAALVYLKGLGLDDLKELVK